MFCKSVGILLLVAPFTLAQTTHSTKRLTAAAPNCPVIKSDLDKDLDGPCYILDGFLKTKGNISVAPGTKLIFRAESTLLVEENTSFSAIGTPDRPILMTGQEHTPGFWSGIDFSSVSGKNRLSYVQVSDAGANNGSSSGAVRLSNKGVASIDHTMIRNALTIGFSAPSYTRVLNFEANTLENNGIPLEIHLDALGKIDPSTQFFKNKKQFILVNTGDANEDASWPAFSVPVHIKNFTKILSNIQIQPGAQFFFDQSTGLYVEDQGSIRAEGTAEKPIVFTSENEIPGAWNGLGISTRNAKNILNHVEVLWAGGNGNTGAIDVGSTSNAIVKITNSTIRGSQHAGVTVEVQSSTIPSPNQLTQQNKIVENMGPAVEIK